MNVIEKTRSILKGFGKLADFVGDIQIDFTEDKADSYGLSAMTPFKVAEDIRGNKTWQQNFTLSAYNRSFNDYDRLLNSSFLSDLAHYLETIKDQAITLSINNVDIDGLITEIQCSQGMTYDVPTGDINDGIMYQVIIYVEYKYKN